MVVDTYTVMLSLGAAFFLGAIFAKLAVKMIKVAFVVVFVALVVSQLPLSTSKVCEMTEGLVSESITAPLCR